MGLLQDGYPGLALLALGSFLWSPEALGELADTKLSNTDLLSAVRAMDTVHDGFSRRSVAWLPAEATGVGRQVRALRAQQDAAAVGREPQLQGLAVRQHVVDGGVFGDEVDVDVRDGCGAAVGVDSEAESTACGRARGVGAPPAGAGDREVEEAQRAEERGLAPIVEAREDVQGAELEVDAAQRLEAPEVDGAKVHGGLVGTGWF